MLEQLLSTNASQQISDVVKTHPFVVLTVLQNLPAFQCVKEALTEEQQIKISTNVPRLSNFLSSPQGKSSIALMAEEFTSWIQEDNKVK